MRTLVVLDAPSNLGLRPPAPGTVPGCYKLAGALREQRHRAAARTPWRAGSSCRRATTAATGRRATVSSTPPPSPVHPSPSPTASSGMSGPGTSRSSSAATAPSSSAPPSPCAASAGTGWPRSTARADFRHPGNSDRIGAAGGEELALATGRGQADLTDLEGLRPYLRDEDVRLFGIRDESTRTGPSSPR